MAVQLSGRLILASASPRRRELLRGAGYEFDVVPPPVHEPVAPAHSIAPGFWAEALAYFKARSVAESHPEAIVVGADTVVTHGGRMIGKPKDVADARRILSSMFAGRNEVITGLAVVYPPNASRIITHVTTVLTMRAMRREELEEYLAGGAWRGKAGAYALQEGGDRFVESIVGSESNVVGLPMEKLEEILAQWKSRV